MFKLGCILLLMLLAISACTTGTDTYAPVTEISTIEPIPKKGLHRVSSDETLYSIAWRYGLDYRVLAARNHIKPPYAIQTGQLIYLTQKTSLKAPPKTLKKIVIAKPSKPKFKPSMPQVNLAPVQEKEPTAHISAWRWPVYGPIIGRFSAANKGINIGGQEGQPIFASATGKVVYSGHGLRGYGNLIIIKHNSTFLTAYAHNRRVYVMNGDWVKNGQKIAEMGKTGAPRVMLHFEIRRNGQPVNPLMYLAKKI